MKREMSSIERMVWMGGQFIAHFAIAARIQGVVSVPSLQMAIRKACQRHPLLAVRVVQTDDGTLWLSTEDVPEPALTVSTRQHESDWISTAVHELEIPFDWQTGPLVRFALVNGTGASDLIVTCHHCIADGLSAAFLIRDLLLCLGDPQYELEPLPMLPGLDELLPELAPEVFAQVDAPFGLANDDSAVQPGNLICLVHDLTLAQTSALVERCHQENISVHAALCAAFLLAFDAVQPDGKPPMRRISSPVSLRDRLTRPIGENFGLFITSYIKTGLDDTTEGNFWDIARYLRDDLNSKLDDANLFIPFYLMRQMAEAQPYEIILQMLLASGGPVVDYDLSITNLGRLPVPEQYGPLVLDALYGPMLNATLSERVVGVSTVGGKMHFALVWRDHVMPRADGQALLDNAIQQLIDSVQ